jgi:hypothetical protein
MEQNICTQIQSFLEGYKFSEGEIESIKFKLLTLAKDTSIVQFLNLLGKDEHHRALNSKSFFYQLRYGFEAFTINESGWLTNPSWLNHEEIKFGCTSEPEMININIGMGQNGKWASGHGIDYGGSGEYSSYSIFSKPFNDKQSAFNHEYAYCMNKFQSAIEREESKTQRDSTNFNVPNMRATIKTMKQYVASKKQLSLF